MVRQQTQWLGLTTGPQLGKGRWLLLGGHHVARDHNVYVFLGAASEDALGLGHGEAAQSPAVDVDDLVTDEKAAIPEKRTRKVKQMNTM